MRQGSFENVAEEIDHSTWMVCPYCRGEAVLLKRMDDGRHCPRCGRVLLQLCNSVKK